MVKRCEHCNNKVTNKLVVVSCKCGIPDLCSSCKDPNLHNCTFDHVKANQEKLKVANTKIEANKVQKI